MHADAANIKVLLSSFSEKVQKWRKEVKLKVKLTRNKNEWKLQTDHGKYALELKRKPLKNPAKLRTSLESRGWLT